MTAQIAQTLTEALDASLADLTLAPEDAAVVKLARLYAQQIDSGRGLSRLGPALQTTLDSLGMTPRARAALTTGKPAPGSTGPSPLDELRRKREQRAQ